MNELVHKYIRGDTAVKICASIEAAVREGHIPSGHKLPTVRELATHLAVSPATVAAAYQALQARGLAFAQGRRGTHISHRPVFMPQSPPPVPDGAVDLSDGNPDPALLPDMTAALATISATPRLYGESPQDPDLAELVQNCFAEDGVAPGPTCVVNGALDGMERVMAEHLGPGDRVAVEDPGFSGILELLMSRGLQLEPVPMDDEGLRPDGLARACAQGVRAVVVTPRAHNPTGAATSANRARELRRVLRDYPDVLTIEDDHASWICDVPLERIHEARRPKWALVRSYCKALNPDLRVAVLTGDPATMQRVQERLVMGERWVSHILQRLAYAQLSDPKVCRKLMQAAQTYSDRRIALLEALEKHGVDARAASGYNVWLPVPDESATVQALLAKGWAVAAGQRFRIHTPPAIRITTARLATSQAMSLAKDVASALRPAAHAVRV